MILMNIIIQTTKEKAILSRYIISLIHLHTQNILKTYRLSLQSLTQTVGSILGILCIYWADEGVWYTNPTNVYVIVYNSAIHQQCVAAL